jgi:3-hydroxypropanoate dehydrogenase
MSATLDKQSLDRLFGAARSHYQWTDQPVRDEQLREMYELIKMGPTSANGCPARFVWVKSPEGKQRLSTCVLPANRSKILSAPVTVIIAYDLEFAEQLTALFPARSAVMKAMFDDPSVALETAFRNGSLQGAYLMLAARALGLDCGPMSGFNAEEVDREFFAGSPLKSNFLCCLGYGASDALFPRLPRLSFEDAGRFA